ncbi:MAG: phosphatase PAP2 family protein [Rudaea sp.]
MRSKTDRNARHFEPRRRRFTGWFFPSYLILSAVFVIALGVSARRKPYFSLDLTIEKRIQEFRPTWFDRLMRLLSWSGYFPQANVVGGGIVLALWRLGLVWEAEMELVIIFGAAALFYAVLAVVGRPRPTDDLVRVSRKIPLGSFPSGHAISFSSTLGFLGFLAYSSALPRPVRRLIASMIGVVLFLTGVARVYSGEHWPSDVIAGYLIGLSWLGVALRLYRARKKVNSARA